MKRVIALLLCLGLLFCGCTREKKAYVPTGDGLTPLQKTTAPTSAEDSEPAFSLAYNSLADFNPYTCQDLTNRTLFSLLYQGLFSVNRDGVAEPVLCSDYTRSEDMLTYTFTLADATFSDGQAVEAMDVATSLRRAWDSDYYGGRFLHIAEINAVGTDTVVITLDAKYENLPVLLDIPIVKQGTADVSRPMGSGPYALVDGRDGMTLRRVSDWWCSANLAVDQAQIGLEAMTSATQIRDGFEFSNIGLACTDPGASTYADYRCDYELWDCSTGILVYLGCNANSPVLSNGTLRAALTYAMDREAFVEESYRGFARSATLAADPASPYYNATLAASYDYTPGHLEQVLRETGLEGQNLVLLVNSADQTRLFLARQIAETLTDCGLPTTTLEQSGVFYQEALTLGNYDFYLGQTKLSPNMDLSEFFKPGGALSYGGMDDGATYAMCLQALENSGNYYNLHQMIANDGQLIPLLFRTYAVYVGRGTMTNLTPARDDVFHYTLLRSTVEAVPSEPEESEPENTELTEPADPQDEI